MIYAKESQQSSLFLEYQTDRNDYKSSSLGLTLGINEKTSIGITYSATLDSTITLDSSLEVPLDERDFSEELYGLRGMTNEIKNIYKVSYTECESEIVNILVGGGGHNWPPAQPNQSVSGYSTQNLNASKVIWEFFKSHIDKSHLCTK